VGALEVLAPALHEGAVLLEDQDRVVGVGVEVDPVLGVDADVAVGAADVLSCPSGSLAQPGIHSYLWIAAVRG
jgi:hypothetical protein